LKLAEKKYETAADFMLVSLHSNCGAAHWGECENLHEQEMHSLRAHRVLACDTVPALQMGLANDRAGQRNFLTVAT